MVSVSGVISRSRYAMYVWTTGWDSSIPGCDEGKFLTWDSTCMSHTWDTPAKRQWLWDTCNLPGREVDLIFLSDVHRPLERGYLSNDCSLPEIQRIKTALTEGHARVPDLKIYALYAVSDLPVSEQFLVKFVVWYNDICAASAAERFDGIAVNNEAFSKIKCGKEKPIKTYLDNLMAVKKEAKKQANGVLKTHYSIGWHWGLQCSTGPATSRLISWGGKRAKVTTHMIDIFDSVDAQVAYTRTSQVVERSKWADYDYAVTAGKPFYTTIYTNKGTACQTTYFPQSCPWGEKTEAAMFALFDSYPKDIEHARPCIHYFRGIYSSGGHSDWPAHKQSRDVLVG
ncbi:uncharacterized protein LOC106151742 isoform X1 [Lingula anatina]|uniref:Uncharacterized protein LOC106151742 isoform X1 n=1 Tax=Lingula anatina TaxID=7574 RepID=A0A1S3H3K7_LINAN|nr:uncharacterized protein LOC106151742 isoform X1 [Lingula anatina]|eukprot:XP_013380583.1 uncharacterized protein LOC106151742 isoform X1 [Lingula anatina]